MTAAAVLAGSRRRLFGALLGAIGDTPLDARLSMRREDRGGLVDESLPVEPDEFSMPPAAVRWLTRGTFGFTQADLAAFNALGRPADALKVIGELAGAGADLQRGRALVQLGRAVDGLGNPIDGGGPLHASGEWPAGGKRAGALDRASVREPFDTGVRAINALTSLGVGQRVGIMAGSGVGKSVLIDMIAEGAEAEIVVVGLIGERAREVSDFVERHMQGEVAARTAIVAVPADHAANLRLRGALLATSLAEHFRAQGRKVLLIQDSLTRIAHAAREIGILLGEPGAARGYPPSALSTITKLVERAGNSAESGGSITAIYTVLADGDDQNDPVVDTARSILDGHIVLSRELAQRGQYPAIDVGASLSRVMSDVAPPEQLALARRFRALVSAYEANRDLVLLGAYRSGADPLVDQGIALQPQISAFISQAGGEHVSLSQSQDQLRRLIGNGE